LSVETDPHISAVLLSMLNFWHHGQAFPLCVPIPVLRAAQDQRIIGLRGLVEGLLSIKWAQVQQDHYSSIRSGQSGRRWASLLIHRLWLLGFVMWEHRNNCLHSEESVQNKRLSTALDREFHREFSVGPMGLPSAALFLFRCPSDHRLRTFLADRKKGWTSYTWNAQMLGLVAAPSASVAAPSPTLRECMNHIPTLRAFDNPAVPASSPH
jgi:hypothetical protein